MALNSLPSAQLSAAFHDAVALLETTSKATSSQNIETTLKNRLEAYYKQQNDQDALRCLEKAVVREEIELLTGREALSLVQRIQKLMDVQVDESSEEPQIGTRDLAKLRTLLSLAFKWGIERLYAEVGQSWSGSVSENLSQRRVFHKSAIDDDYRLLSDLTASLLSLVFPEGAQGRISQTFITSTILAKHVTDLLFPSISLGWLPETMSTSSMPAIHAFRPLVTRLLNL